MTTINGKLEVIVGGGDANLYALDAATGQVLWKTPFPGAVTKQLHLEFAHSLQREHLYRLVILWGLSPDARTNAAIRCDQRKAYPSIRHCTQWLHGRWYMVYPNH